MKAVKLFHFVPPLNILILFVHKAPIFIRNYYKIYNRVLFFCAFLVTTIYKMENICIDIKNFLGYNV